MTVPPASHRGPRGCALALLLLGSLLAGMPGGNAIARDDRTDRVEYEVKAAFLYNFTKFVTWPHQSGPFRVFSIGVIGEDPFGAILDQAVTGKPVEDQRIVVRRIENLTDIRGCEVLYVSRSENRRLSEIFDQLHGLPVLTVGETEAFAQAGGMIRFLLQDDHVRFEVNANAMAAARLQVSSRLLQVAVNVREDRRKEN
jgi:hypothetical protein